jgi:hypothetical protein
MGKAILSRLVYVSLTHSEGIVYTTLLQDMNLVMRDIVVANSDEIRRMYRQSDVRMTMRSDT